MTIALLALADGTVFEGLSVGAAGSVSGEVVFNTAMTGYQEILTDPSYANQLVTLTTAHVGNTGINNQDMESARAWCEALIVRHVPVRPSSWRSQMSIQDFLSRKGIVAISEIDTRKLTRLIRDCGAQSACLVAGDNLDEAKALAEAKSFSGLAGMDLAKKVTTAEPYEWSQGTWMPDNRFRTPGVGTFHVVAYDFGVKQNILRLLCDRGCKITVVPAQTSAQDVIDMKPDGVFLSNGPGDPEPCKYAIDAIRTIISQSIPVFGICLGHQLLALASGARTEKMKFGHHGANHPIKSFDTGRVFITSQNHGFTVSEDKLPANIRVTHRSLFDDSIQGIERTDAPAYSFQGHPEASPGPHDSLEFFERFVSMMKQSQRASRS